MEKVFLDTNVVVDFLCERSQFYLPAARIVVKAYHKEIMLCCSSLTFATASYLMGKSKLDSATIFQKLSSFCTLCTPTIVDQTTIDEALHSEFADFEDAMQYFSARRFDADVIITRNKDDFEKSQIPCYEPMEYLLQRT
ncbi:MAG: PIN domain-containing protein [Prevotella sp.]|nr:PIN domain-containing protein [Prevotella sp.]